MTRFFLKSLPRLFDIAVIAFISCIPLLWIPNGQILTGHDSGYPINVIEAYKNRFFTWNSQDSFGLDNTTSISVIPILSIQAAASRIGLSVADSERVTFVFWFFAMHVGMYLLAFSLRDIFRYRWFPLLAAFLYVFNFYLLALWRYGAGTTFSAYTTLPLTVMICIGVMRSSSHTIRSGILLAAVLFLFNGGGGLSLPLFGGLLTAFVLVFVYFIALATGSERKELYKRSARFVGVAIVTSLFLNAYWLFPFLYYVITTYYSTLQAVGGKAAVLKWTDSVSVHTSISNLFRLQGFPDWYDNPYHPYANQFLQKKILIVISMLFAPAAYAAVLLVRQIEQKKVVLYFTGLSLLGIFFSAGSHPPTGWLYSLFMLYVPGFVVFRSAQYKFIPALLLSFAILISFTVNYLISESKFFAFYRPAIRRVLSSGAIAAVFVLVLIYHFPYFQRGFFYYNRNLSTLLTIPDYIESFDSWSKDNLDDEGRTLILPRFNSVWKAALFNWNYFSLYSPLNLIRPKPFIQYSYYLNESQFAMFNRLAKEIQSNSTLAGNLLTLFQVRHILLAGDIAYKSTDIPSESPDVYRDVLSQKKTYPLVWNEGPWQIYQVPTYTKNKIYSVSGLTQLNGQPKDAVGAVLWGTTDFILQQIVGKSIVNPSFESLPIRDVISGVVCFTCELQKQEADIVPRYTSILPGSLLYRIKRWREKTPDENTASVETKISHRLGLSLKRISELASLGERNVDADALLPVIAELTEHWDSVQILMPSSLDSPEAIDVVARIYDFAMSEDRIVNKMLGNSPKYTTATLPFQKQLGVVIKRIETLKNVYDDRAVYRLPDEKSEGIFYLDPLTLATGTDGKRVLPIGMMIGDRFVDFSGIAKNPLSDRFELGAYEGKPKELVTLIFPKRQSLLGETTRKAVTIDSRKQMCQISQIQGFDWERTYRLVINNASALSSSTQFYLRKNKINSDTFSIEDDVVIPDYAYNFSRYKSTPQERYFSGSDGDTGAYIYQCVTIGDEETVLTDSISVHEIVKPTLYIYSGTGEKQVHQNISYTRINQTKYVVDLSRATFPLVLVFNENYNGLWRLSPIDSTGNILEILRYWRPPSYAENMHMQVNGYANAWYLKEKPAKSLILEFYPQSLFYKGVLVTVVGIIGIVIFMVIKRKNI